MSLYLFPSSPTQVVLPPDPRAIHVQKPAPRPGSLPRVETEEPASGPWDSPGTYGRRIEVNPGPVNAAGIGAAFAVFENPKFRGPPRPRTVQLFRSDLNNVIGGTTPNADFYARLIYGLNGIVNQIVCDWINGAQFQVPCQMLRVEALAYQPNRTVIYEPGTGLTVLGAMAADGPCACPVPMTFTTQVVNLPGNDGVSFEIPNMARRAFPLVFDTNTAAPTVAADYSINFSVDRAGYGTNTSSHYEVTDEILAMGVPVPGGAKTIEIRTAPAGAPALSTVGVCFQLAL